MIDRRSLLVNGLVAASSLPLLTSLRVLADSPALMQRKIPKTGEAIPVVGMGSSGSFEVGGSPAEREPLVAVLEAFFAAGGSLIDTAPSYSTAEGVIGDLLSAGGWRKRTFLCTKVSARAGDPARAQWNASLQALHTSSVDLLQVHNLVDLPANLAFLRELKAQGGARYIGVTHYLPSAHEELTRIAEHEPIDFIQVDYSVTNRSAERRLLPACRERGIAVLVNRAFDDGKIFGRVKGKPVPDWAAEVDCSSWAQLFLKFVIADPAVTAVIPATSKPRNMLDNLGAGRGRLPDARFRERIVAALN